MQWCFRLFRELGDSTGMRACLRAMAAVRDEVPYPQATLTAWQRQVASLIAAGLNDREIAEALEIARGTARRHVADILNKLGFRSRSQVAGWFVEGQRATDR